MIPSDWPEWVADAVEAGAEVVIESETGGTESFAGGSTGAAQSTVGESMQVSIDGNPLIIDAGLGRLEGGKYAMTARGKAVTLDQATPIIAGSGILLLLAAGFCVYRGAIRPAIVCGGLGVGLIAGAFYPWLFLLGLLAVLAGIVFYFRDSIGLADARRALRATVAQVEDHMGGTAGKPAFEDGMRKRIGNDLKAKWEIKRAKGVKA